jgi:hypothetical protein
VMVLVSQIVLYFVIVCGGAVMVEVDVVMLPGSVVVPVTVVGASVYRQSVSKRGGRVVLR